MTRGRVEALFARARAGQVGRVVAELEVELAEAPDDAEGWLALGLVLADQGRWTEALAPLARAAGADDAPLVARATFARALEIGGHLEGARAELTRARLAAPEHVGIARSLASLLRRAGDLDGADAALASVEGAARVDAERAAIAVDRGAIARMRGDLSSALAWWTTAIARDAARDDARLATAEARAEVGDFAAALAQVDTALTRDPENAAASRLRTAIARARTEARATRLLGHSGPALFRPAGTGDARAEAEGVARFLADALGAGTLRDPAAAAYVLARLAAEGTVDLDDARVSATERDGVTGVRVALREA